MVDAAAGVRIVRLVELSDGPRLWSEIDAIFFAASGTQAFADAAERDRFRERWLGRYLEHDTDDTLLALDVGGTVLGYLVGARTDPARAPRFADIAYFTRLADLTARHPAHLHINLAQTARGRGVGGRLIEAFCSRLVTDGIPGVHVVTGAAARNRAFYARLGFETLRTLDWNGRAIVMLGRRLAAG